MRQTLVFSETLVTSKNLGLSFELESYNISKTFSPASVDNGPSLHSKKLSLVRHRSQICSPFHPKSSDRLFPVGTTSIHFQFSSSFSSFIHIFQPFAYILVIIYIIQPIVSDRRRLVVEVYPFYLFPIVDSLVAIDVFIR